jgi:hypothetical protein
MSVLNHPNCGGHNRVFPVSFCLSALFTVLLASCSTPLKVNSNPPGATITVDGASKGVTPADVELDNTHKPYVITIRKDGYAPETIEVQKSENRKELNVALQELLHKETFHFTSTPSKATILIDGRDAGHTPADVPVTFERAAKEDPWKTVEVQFVLKDYQTETQKLTSWQVRTIAQNLELLHDETDVTFAYKASNGQTLTPQISVDGELLPNTPSALHFQFNRSNKTEPWSTHTVKADIPGIYLPQTYRVERTGPQSVTLVLAPLTEVDVVRNFPRVSLSAKGTGAEMAIDTTSHIGTINLGENGTEIQELARITRFDRHEANTKNRTQSLNSYAITPDGQSAILSVTFQDDQGNYYANLFLKKTSDEGGGLSRLTDSTRHYDTLPVIAPDGSNLLIFQSNRSERTKTDIFRVQLAENRFSGGIARITNDTRFNFNPTYADSNREIVYLSLEAAYPLARPQISTVRFDGSLPTQLQLTAAEVSQREIDHIYYVKDDENTGKSQIYSVLPDGKLETLLITDESFRNTNCINPVSSYATPRRILFVSDKEKDEKGRPQNDLYVMNADGSGIQRLTTNTSDDIAPSWSPTEPDVVYFMSNRGGAYNLWRMRLRAGR